MNLFLSYSSEDHSDVAALERALVNYGYSVWFAPKSIRSGDSFSDEIERALRNSDTFILFATSNSVGCGDLDGSPYVKDEIVWARNLGLPVLPIDVDGSLARGAGSGFGYLLTSYQNISDCGPSIKSSNFDYVAKVIDGHIKKKNVSLDLAYFNEKISEAEKLLKDKKMNQAYSYLSQFSFPTEYKDIVSTLKIIALLQSKPVKNLSKSDADKYVQQLSSLGSDNVMTVKLYVMAILSEFYYRRNAVADPTGGVLSLLERAREHDKLKAKYIKMTDGIIGNNSNFVSCWR